jgi:hypothetical protein
MSDEPAWLDFYRELWPNLHLAIRIDGQSRMQRDGIDRELILTNGRRFYVDEKKRKKDYGDLLLEEWSVFYREGDPRNKIGWTLDGAKRCDFIAYAVPAASKCYFLPFEHMRQAFIVNRSEWLRQYRTIDVQNDGYLTRNVPIPFPVIKAEISRQMTRGFRCTLDLPPAVTVGKQIEFIWGDTI